MKANRWSKDEDGADSSDAIIALALILGIALVAVYLVGNLGGVGKVISDWGAGVGEWAGDIGEGIGAGLFGSSSTINISEAEESVLKEMYDYDVFILTSNNTQTNYKATLDHEGDGYRRYELSALGNATSTTDSIFGDAIERAFGYNRIVLKTFTITDDAMSRLEKLREGQTLTLQGAVYAMKITAHGRPVGINATYTIEIMNAAESET